MTAPTLYWMRRDFRLADNPALAAINGRIIPVFIADEQVQSLGAAPKFRLGRAISSFQNRLKGKGGTLILRRGAALKVLQDLIAETGASRVVWNRLYDPDSIKRDARVKAVLKTQNVTAESFNAHLLFEPWEVQTGQGGPYRVYSPFWRSVRGRSVAAPAPTPRAEWAKNLPASEDISDWGFETAMRRGADVVGHHLLLGEVAAKARLGRFLDEKVDRYKADRDLLDQDACSNLSEPLAYGEIGPRQIWQAGWRAMEDGAAGGEHFLKELVWREFAYHLMYHTPHILTRNWREEWDGFDWHEAGEAATRWQRGQTGVDVIDAAMRELYVTGRMHNRARMLVASYLTKHLMVDWRVGQQWFADTLVDWDPAANAMGWQWVAGSGPDAAPFFRIFNPETQAEKFDAKAGYRNYWLRGEGAEEFTRAAPLSWPPRDDNMAPMVTLPEGRTRALAAYKALKS